MHGLANFKPLIFIYLLHTPVVIQHFSFSLFVHLRVLSHNVTLDTLITPPCKYCIFWISVHCLCLLPVHTIYCLRLLYFLYTPCLLHHRFFLLVLSHLRPCWRSCWWCNLCFSALCWYVFCHWGLLLECIHCKVVVLIIATDNQVKCCISVIIVVTNNNSSGD